MRDPLEPCTCELYHKGDPDCELHHPSVIEDDDERLLYTRYFRAGAEALFALLGELNDPHACLAELKGQNPLVR